MTEHTKTPWIANDQHSGLDTRWRVESEHEHGVVNYGWIICNCYGPDAESNAKFIVRACNHHAELVAALKRIASGEGYYGAQAAEYKQIARDVLSKLEVDDAK